MRATRLWHAGGAGAGLFFWRLSRRAAGVEEGLQDDLRGERVAESFLSGGGEAGGLHVLIGLEAAQALVPQLDGQVAQAVELVGEVLGELGLGARRPVHVQWQADHEALDFVLGGPAQDRAGIFRSGSGAVERGGGLGDRLARVAEGQPEAAFPVIDPSPACHKIIL
jgi:hypothetical protein